MKLGATGHQDIPPDALELIASSLREILDAEALRGDLVGYTSLAAGADQLFARLLVEARGVLRVVVPCAGYEQTFSNDRKALQQFTELLQMAVEVERLHFDSPTEEAFYAAGRQIVDRCDVLIAIWDGRPARGLGGTADVVSYAKAVGKDVTIVWPLGVTRD